MSLGRKKSKTKTKALRLPVAHFVTPAYKLAAAKRGEEVKSLCGEVNITGDPKPGAAVCQKCVLAQMDVDDKKTADQARSASETAARNATAQREAGKREGVAVGRADSMREIREAAERRAGEVKQPVPAS